MCAWGAASHTAVRFKKDGHVAEFRADWTPGVGCFETVVCWSPGAVWKESLKLALFAQSIDSPNIVSTCQQSALKYPYWSLDSSAPEGVFLLEHGFKQLRLVFWIQRVKQQGQKCESKIMASSRGYKMQRRLGSGHFGEGLPDRTFVLLSLFMPIMWSI